MYSDSLGAGPFPSQSTSLSTDPLSQATTGSAGHHPASRSLSPQGRAWNLEGAYLAGPGALAGMEEGQRLLPSTFPCSSAEVGNIPMPTGFTPELAKEMFLIFLKIKLRGGGEVPRALLLQGTRLVPATTLSSGCFPPLPASEALSLLPCAPQAASVTAPLPRGCTCPLCQVFALALL